MFRFWDNVVGVLAMLMLMNSRVSCEVVTCSGMVPMVYRNDKISITDFGGVGDGQTLNTKAFREAVYRIEHLKRRGGTLLYIPSGVYLTGSFNLTSHMTLYLAKGAVIKATQVASLVLVLCLLIVNHIAYAIILKVGDRFFTTLTYNVVVYDPIGHH